MGINFEKKQLTLISMIIVAFFLLGWQIYKLVSDDIVSSGKVLPVLAENSNTAEALPNDTKLPIRNAVIAPKLVTNLPPVLASEQNTITSNQPRYLKLVNQFEFAKMQHKLLGQEVAIAQAEQQIAEIKNKTPIVSFNKNENSLVRNNSSNTNTSNTPHYHLAYLDHQGETWNATIEVNGQYENANQGDVLNDGGRVIRVDKTGVLISNNNYDYDVGFNGVKISQATIVDARPITLYQPQKLKPSTPQKQTSNPVLKKSSSNINQKPISPLSLLPANEFTIHLEESGGKDALDNTIRVYHLEKKAIIYERTEDGKPDFVLIYNTYPSSQAAEAALSKLPAALQEQDVWVEQIKTLKR